MAKSRARILRTAITAEPRLPLWISHLWQRLHDHKRLGLILGAGVAADGGCPLWTELVRRLATPTGKGKNRVIDRHRRAGLADTYLTQILYSLHSETITHTSPAPPHLRRFHADATWMNLVHEELYKDNKDLKFSNIAKKHIYLQNLGELVCRAKFAINFNFDDVIDEAAILYAADAGIELPEIIWRPKVETRRDAAVIYHINGYLPRDIRRKRSESLIFTEEAFADVLISPYTPDAEFTMSRFGNTTFLILGTSLSDNSLKNMLRAAIRRNSANHHYIIYWVDPAAPRTPEERSHIFNVNLDVYNLISIFLTTKEIAELLRLLNIAQAADFITEMTGYGLLEDRIRRRYYLVGSVASGKSSNLEALRCFTTFEEWSKLPPATMYQDHRTLTSRQRREINEWVYAQLRDKNEKMRAMGPGIAVMDRAFLDLFAFSTSDADNLRKATDIQHKVIGIGGEDLRTGQILFLNAEQAMFEERLARRGRLPNVSAPGYNAAELIAQAAALQQVYSPTQIIDTSRSACDITAREIARTILLGDYVPFDFSKRLKEVCTNSGRLA